MLADAFPLEPGDALVLPTRYEKSWGITWADEPAAQPHSIVRRTCPCGYFTAWCNSEREADAIFATHRCAA